MTNFGDGKYSPITNWSRGCLMNQQGMGAVFIGKNVDNGQLFIVKSVPSEPVWSKQLAALQNEEQILRKLSNIKCPNILHTLGSATSESVAEMGGKPTMDLFLEFALPEGNLTEIINLIEKLKESVAKAYTFQILQALSCMHKNGIAHRDIRGMNIIVCEKHVKLIGFGQAKDFSRHLAHQCSWAGREKQSDGHTSSRFGPQKSIEKQAGIFSRPECLEDISALGMVVCEMITGHRPNLVPSLPVDKAIRSLEEDLVNKSMGNCMSFIQRCLLPQIDFEGKDLGIGPWTAERLLTHPWIASMEPVSPSDFSYDEGATGSSTYRDNSALLLKTDAITHTPLSSPRVTALKKCADKMCCRRMDTDNVIPPLSSRSLNSEHRTPRKGSKLSRVLTKR